MDDDDGVIMTPRLDELIVLICWYRNQLERYLDEYDALGGPNSRQVQEAHERRVRECLEGRAGIDTKQS